jgi:ABC-type Fe3+/spermidine/putrescine transport system ATPase subunit
MAHHILELRRINKRFGATVVANDLSLTVERGEFFTFLGPSGSGKSSVLRIVAGLERPDSGTVVIDGKDVSKVPPWDRNLGMMFQSYAIFPHMTVGENVGYGLKVRGHPPAWIARRTKEMLALVGLSGLETKNATLLSGGEQQRVALARALAPEPRMLLLDEPLSALDEKIRRSMEVELKRIHQKTGTTFLYVTHDQEEAMTMSDRIAVFNQGACVECGKPERLYRRPRTRFAAGFFRGCNVLEARRDPSGRVVLGGVDICIPDLPPTAGDHVVYVAVRAENVLVAPPYAEGAVTIRGRLDDVTFRGTVLDYHVSLADGQTLTATSTRRIGSGPADMLEVRIAPQDIVVLED